MNVVFLSDRKIRIYNRKYLGHDWPTDVIAFSYPPFAELLISLDTAKRQARELGHPFFHEIKILLIHGLLHLIGYKDKKKKDQKEMWAETEKLLKKVKGA